MSKKLVAIAVGASLAVMLIWYVALWGPRRSSIKAAKARTEAAQSQAADLRVRLSRLQDLQQGATLRRSQLETLRVAVPDQPNLAQFILDANDAATHAGIDFLSVSPAPPAATTAVATSTAGKPAQGAGPSSISIGMNITGGYFQILDFMNRLNDLPRIVVIDSINVTGANGATATPGGGLTVSLQGRMFMNGTPPTAPSAAPAPGSPTAPTTTVPGGASPPTTSPASLAAPSAPAPAPGAP